MEILQDEKKPVVEKGRLKWAHQREFVATARVRNSIKSKLKKKSYFVKVQSLLLMSSI